MDFFEGRLLCERLYRRTLCRILYRYNRVLSCLSCALGVQTSTFVVNCHFLRSIHSAVVRVGACGCRRLFFCPST